MAYLSRHDVLQFDCLIYVNKVAWDNEAAYHTVRVLTIKIGQVFIFLIHYTAHSLPTT